MEVSFIAEMIRLFDFSLDELEKKSHLFSHPKRMKLNRLKLAQIIFNYYNYLIKTSQTLQKSSAKISAADVTELELMCLSDLDKLQLTPEEVDGLRISEHLFNFISQLERLALFDLPSVLCLQSYLGKVDASWEAFWKSVMHSFNLETQFSLTAPFQGVFVKRHQAPFATLEQAKSLCTQADFERLIVMHEKMAELIQLFLLDLDKDFKKSVEITLGSKGIPRRTKTTISSIHPD